MPRPVPATAWNPDPSNTNPIPSYIGTGIFALTVDGSTVYTGGAFTSIGGRPRANIAALDAATGTATDWNPGANFYVQALSVSGSTVYAGGSFTSIGGQARSYVAALDATTGTATAWDPSANNHVVALAVDGSTVYAGGGFRSIGGLPQSGIAALGDNTTATLLAQFVAASTEDGIELRWMFGDPSRVTTVGVERASHSAGPWLPPPPSCVTNPMSRSRSIAPWMQPETTSTGWWSSSRVVARWSSAPSRRASSSRSRRAM